MSIANLLGLQLMHDGDQRRSPSRALLISSCTLVLQQFSRYISDESSLLVSNGHVNSYVKFYRLNRVMV